MCTHILDTYLSPRRSVDSHGATVLLFSAALRLHGLPSRSPITMPRSSAAMLSYLRFDVNAYLQSTRITIDRLIRNVAYPAGFVSSSCKKGLLSSKGDGELGLSRSIEKSAFNRSLLRDWPRALLAHDRSVLVDQGKRLLLLLFLLPLLLLDERRTNLLKEFYVSQRKSERFDYT